MTEKASDLISKVLWENPSLAIKVNNLEWIKRNDSNLPDWDARLNRAIWTPNSTDVESLKEFGRLVLPYADRLVLTSDGEMYINGLGSTGPIRETQYTLWTNEPKVVIMGIMGDLGLVGEFKDNKESDIKLVTSKIDYDSWRIKDIAEAILGKEVAPNEIAEERFDLDRPYNHRRDYFLIRKMDLKKR